MNDGTVPGAYYVKLNDATDQVERVGGVKYTIKDGMRGDLEFGDLTGALRWMTAQVEHNKGVHDDAELAPRDVVARENWLQRQQGPIFLDARAIGIDFGTSNTAAAILSDGQPRIVPLEAGHETLPTAVFLDYAARRTVFGSAAVRAMIDGQEGRFMRALKSVLGTPLARERRQFLNRQEPGARASNPGKTSARSSTAISTRPNSLNPGVSTNSPPPGRR